MIGNPEETEPPTFAVEQVGVEAQSSRSTSPWVPCRCSTPQIPQVDRLLIDVFGLVALTRKETQWRPYMAGSEQKLSRATQLNASGCPMVSSVNPFPADWLAAHFYLSDRVGCFSDLFRCLGVVAV